MSKTKILIDCDPGHDDAVAILFAAAPNARVAIKAKSRPLIDLVVDTLLAFD